jgi:hypothetical protein
MSTKQLKIAQDQQSKYKSLRLQTTGMITPLKINHTLSNSNVNLPESLLQCRVSFA